MHIRLLDSLIPFIPTIFGLVGGYESRRFREGSKQQQNVAEEWYDRCLDIIARGAYNIERARFRSDPDYRRILDEIDTFSERLIVKARNSPERVSNNSDQLVSELAEIYAKSSIVGEVSSEKEDVEFLQEMFQLAQKEYQDNPEFNKAMETATEVSEPFLQFISVMNDSGVGTSEFAETTEDIISEWDSEDFVEFVLMGSGNDLDQAIEFGLTIFFTVSNGLSNRVHDQLQAEKTNYDARKRKSSTASCIDLTTSP
jgi:hypothetical protein